MSQAVSPVSGKSYGLAAVCRVWRIARSGVYRHQAAPPDTPPLWRGPMGAMFDEALTAAIRDVLAASPFHGEGHRKVWARLRFAGTRTSYCTLTQMVPTDLLLEAFDRLEQSWDAPSDSLTSNTAAAAAQLSRMP